MDNLVSTRCAPTSGREGSSRIDTDSDLPDRKSSEESSSVPRKLMEANVEVVADESDEFTHQTSGVMDGTADSEADTEVVSSSNESADQVYKSINVREESTFWENKNKVDLEFKSWREILLEVTSECMDEISREVLFRNYNSENDTEIYSNLHDYDILNDNGALSQEKKYHLMQKKIDREIESMEEELERKGEKKRLLELRRQKMEKMEERYYARRSRSREKSSQSSRSTSHKKELGESQKVQDECQWFQKKKKSKGNSGSQRLDNEYDVASEDYEPTWYSNNDRDKK
jgi:hypothetical protein